MFLSNYNPYSSRIQYIIGRWAVLKKMSYGEKSVCRTAHVAGPATAGGPVRASYWSYKNEIVKSVYGTFWNYWNLSWKYQWEPLIYQ